MSHVMRNVLQLIFHTKRTYFTRRGQSSHKKLKLHTKIRTKFARNGQSSVWKSIYRQLAAAICASIIYAWVFRPSLIYDNSTNNIHSDTVLSQQIWKDPFQNFRREILPRLNHFSSIRHNITEKFNIDFEWWAEIKCAKVSRIFFFASDFSKLRRCYELAMFHEVE